jgi:hypothetical protein
MTWSGAHLWLTRSFSQRGDGRRSRIVALVVSASVAVPLSFSTTSYATGAPPSTTSYYERSANPLALYRQGEAAGRSAAQGIVVLDFGRPGDNGVSYGTMGFGGPLIPFRSIARGVENYIRGYYRYAPRYTTLDVAVGTNNSCGTGQPCGGGTCGCPDEPPNFAVWGSQLAVTVMKIGAWALRLRDLNGFTDDVRVVGADDAEPAYDPGYSNTYDLLEGYARTVGGSFPAMVDYGSAEASYWTEDQLLQVAYGFRPDVPMPQVYYPSEAADWGALLRYAKARRGEVMTIFGVLAEVPGTNSPKAAYSDMLQAVLRVTDQRSIRWLSTIHGWPRR